MSIMDFFKTTPGNISGNSDTNANRGGNESLNTAPPTKDAEGNIPGTEPKDENPLDVYKKMFDNASNNSDIQAPSFKIDPTVLGDVSSKMDFTRGINPEVLQKATNGDVNSLMEIIKTVGQNSYKAALEHGTSLTDTFLTQRGEFEGKQVANSVKSQLTTNELSSTANYSHPVVKAELNRIATQFARANPDASPQEVAKAAKQYINDLQSALNPQAKSNELKDGEMDWSKYIGED